MQEKEYLPRLIDKKIDDYLTVFGAILIEGPKWCGKTSTSLNHAKSVSYMDVKATKELAELDVNAIFVKDDEQKPQLIDEWQLVPEVWDAVRRECDNSKNKGNFILTGSTTLKKEEVKEKVKHSGVGRIGRIKMYTMSLYESGDSSGEASLKAMLDGTQKSKATKDVAIKDIANLIIRGGWPENIKIAPDKIGIIPKSYIDSILNIDIPEEKNIDKNKMKMLLRSLARNESTIVNNSTLLKDIEEREKGENVLATRNTLLDYLDDLDRLHLIQNQDAYSANYRSRDRVGKSSKRHFVDPSLACACLNLNADKLLTDLNTFGFMFESLVERDLRIYMDYLEGELYHFRDNVTGLEIDAILEFADGEYAAVEIKLGVNEIPKAKESLLKFKNNVTKEPNFMAIIVGNGNGIAKDKETGIYVVPITTLKP